ncbi:hypothetical protein MASR2M52_00490 [Pedobacter sp.]
MESKLNCCLVAVPVVGSVTTGGVGVGSNLLFLQDPKAKADTVNNIKKYFLFIFIVNINTN